MNKMDKLFKVMPIVCLVVALLLYFGGTMLIDNYRGASNTGGAFIAGSIALLAAVLCYQRRPNP